MRRQRHRNIINDNRARSRYQFAVRSSRSVCSFVAVSKSASWLRQRAPATTKPEQLGSHCFSIIYSVCDDYDDDGDAVGSEEFHSTREAVVHYWQYIPHGLKCIEILLVYNTSQCIALIENPKTSQPM